LFHIRVNTQENRAADPETYKKLVDKYYGSSD